MPRTRQLFSFNSWHILLCNLWGSVFCLLLLLLFSIESNDSFIFTHLKVVFLFPLALSKLFSWFSAFNSFPVIGLDYFILYVFYFKIYI